MDWPHIFAAYFGWPLGAVYSNLVASAICATVVYLRMRAKLHAQQIATMAQAARHHREVIEQADRHHQAATQQRDLHHSQALDLAREHHKAMKEHVTNTRSARGLSGPLKGKAATDG